MPDDPQMSPDYARAAAQVRRARAIVKAYRSRRASVHAVRLELYDVGQQLKRLPPCDLHDVFKRLVQNAGLAPTA